MNPRSTHRFRRGFTIAEAACSAIVLGLLAAATLSSVSAAARSRQLTSDRSVAREAADDLMSEILQQSYIDSTGGGPGPEAGEVSGSSRAAFDDVDDYANLSESPPRNRDGTAVAGLTGWKRATTVDWVTVADPKVTSGFDTSLKRITVVVSRQGRALATAVALRSATWDRWRSNGRTTTLNAAAASVGPTP